MTEYNILIAEGSGELRGKTFRIGHMGPSARKQHIVPLLFGIEKAREPGSSQSRMARHSSDCSLAAEDRQKVRQPATYEGLVIDRKSDS